MAIVNDPTDPANMTADQRVAEVANDSWVVSAVSHWEQNDAARKLQRALDGQVGTAGDVADYQRVIETFAD